MVPSSLSPSFFWYCLMILVWFHPGRNWVSQTTGIGFSFFYPDVWELGDRFNSTLEKRSPLPFLESTNSYSLCRGDKTSWLKTLALEASVPSAWECGILKWNMARIEKSQQNGDNTLIRELRIKKQWVRWLGTLTLRSDCLGYNASSASYLLYSHVNSSLWVNFLVCEMGQ